MRFQARNHETWHNCKQRAQALEGRGSRGGQAWVNNEKTGSLSLRRFHSPRWWILFVTKSTLRALESHGCFHDNGTHLSERRAVDNLR